MFWSNSIHNAQILYSIAHSFCLNKFYFTFKHIILEMMERWDAIELFNLFMHFCSSKYAPIYWVHFCLNFKTWTDKKPSNYLVKLVQQLIYLPVVQSDPLLKNINIKVPGPKFMTTWERKQISKMELFSLLTLLMSWGAFKVFWHRGVQNLKTWKTLGKT